MMPRRRLTREERLAIVRDRAKGVSHQAIADRYGVTTRAIYYVLRTEKERQRESSTRNRVVTVTLSEDELRAFDAVLAKQNIASRSDGLRRLIQAANGLFIPDDQLGAELAGFRAALNRVGNNVSQIAKRMNEAANKGMRPPFSKSSLEQVRALAGFVLDFADQVHLLAQRRQSEMDLRVRSALKELADGAE